MSYLDNEHDNDIAESYMVKTNKQMENLEKSKEIKKEIKIHELFKGVNGELIILADYLETEKILNEVAEKYKDFEVTSENFVESKKVRAKFREYRFNLQNVNKHNNVILNQVKRDDQERFKTLIDITKPTEDKIDAQIKEIENEKKREKEEADRLKKEKELLFVKMLSEYKDKARIVFDNCVSLRSIDNYLDLLIEIEKTDFGTSNFDADKFLLGANNRTEELKDRIKKELYNDNLRKENEAKAQELAEKEKKAKIERDELEMDIFNMRSDQLSGYFNSDEISEKLTLKTSKDEYLEILKEGQSKEVRLKQEQEAKEREEETRDKEKKRFSQLHEFGLKFDGKSSFNGFNIFVDVLDIKTYSKDKWDHLISVIPKQIESFNEIEAEKIALENSRDNEAKEPDTLTLPDLDKKIINDKILNTIKYLKSETLELNSVQHDPINMVRLAKFFSEMENKSNELRESMK